MKALTLNNKGGCGKTTVTVLLGAVLADAGKRVSVRDLDPQGTASSWIRTMNVDRLFDNTSDADVHLVDCPPNFERPEVFAALDQVDAILLVTKPSPLDLWTAAKTAQFLRANYPTKKVRLLFNGVKKGTNMASLLDQMQKQIGIERLQNVVQERQCYVNAAALGLGALTREAWEELRKLALEIIA